MSPIINRIQKEIVILCPLCHKNYKPRHLDTVEQAGETALVHTVCPVCSASVLSLLYRDLLGITMVGLVTDLNFEDAKKFKDAEFVDEDDVLCLYEMVK